MNLKTTRAILLAMGMCLLISPLAAREKTKLPETTKDGLHLVHQDKLSAVYVKPGASLADYNKVMIVDCYVAFQKNWQRNYNQNELDLEKRVTTEDMQKIKARVAEEFPKMFTKVLEKGGYEVVDTVGADVLLLRPAIINLTVTAPYLPTAGISAEIVSSAGSMTLYMELYDSQTSEKFAEVIDAEAVGDDGFAHAANRVSNTADFEFTLQNWAEILVKRLDEAHGKTKR